MLRIRDKAILFFVACPDEELTLADATAKFDSDRATTYSVFATACEDGLLCSQVRKEGKGRPLLHYSAGPLLREALQAGRA